MERMEKNKGNIWFLFIKVTKILTCFTFRWGNVLVFEDIQKTLILRNLFNIKIIIFKYVYRQNVQMLALLQVDY